MYLSLLIFCWCLLGSNALECKIHCIAPIKCTLEKNVWSKISSGSKRKDDSSPAYSGGSAHPGHGCTASTTLKQILPSLAIVA